MNVNMPIIYFHKGMSSIVCVPSFEVRDTWSTRKADYSMVNIKFNDNVFDNRFNSIKLTGIDWEDSNDEEYGIEEGYQYGSNTFYDLLDVDDWYTNQKGESGWRLGHLTYRTLGNRKLFQMLHGREKIDLMPLSYKVADELNEHIGNLSENQFFWKVHEMFDLMQLVDWSSTRDYVDIRQAISEFLVEQERRRVLGQDTFYEFAGIDYVNKVKGYFEII